jgi:hypothetical protein
VSTRTGGRPTPDRPHDRAPGPLITVVLNPCRRRLSTATNARHETEPRKACSSCSSGKARRSGDCGAGCSSRKAPSRPCHRSPSSRHSGALAEAEYKCARHSPCRWPRSQAGRLAPRRRDRGRTLQPHQGLCATLGSSGCRRARCRPRSGGTGAGATPALHLHQQPPSQWWHSEAASAAPQATSPTTAGPRSLRPR